MRVGEFREFSVIEFKEVFYGGIGNYFDYVFIIVLYSVIIVVLVNGDFILFFIFVIFYWEVFFEF